MVMLCATDINNCNQANAKEWQPLELMQSVLREVDEYFNSWLQDTTYKKFDFLLTRSQCICFHSLLERLPINVSQQYINNLKDHLITIIYNHIYE